MENNPMPEKRPAVGEIMAALILMMIVSLAGVLLFTTALRTSSAQGIILRSQIEDDGEIVQERFSNLFTSINQTGVNSYNLTIWVYNYGKKDCKIVDIYIKDPYNGNEIIKHKVNNLIINTNDVEKIYFNITTSSDYSSFEVNIISERGVSHVSSWDH
jgi:hypothetical protein